MNGLPYYKAYPKDFFDGTAGMDFEVKGAYRLILDMIYMHGGRLVDDPRFIAGHIGCSVRKWNGLRSAVLATGKIVLTDGYLGNYRADKELDSLRLLQDKQRKNASEPRKNSQLTLAMAEPKSSHTESDTDTDKKEKRASASSSKERVIEILCQFVERPAAESFYGYRAKSRHKALTETGANRLCKQLAAIKAAGGDCADAVGMAEERGWATVELDWYQKARGPSNGQLNLVHSRSDSGPAMDGIMRRLAQRRMEAGHDR